MFSFFPNSRELTATPAVQWDVLVHGSVVKEEVTIARGVGNDDTVTVLHCKVPHHKP